MGSIVAGSTYLFAPPPKSPTHTNHFIASVLCHPLVHPHLLLQLQRKDPDTRHASPQFDLVCRRSGRRRQVSPDPEIAPLQRQQQQQQQQAGRRPRELAILHSDSGDRIALVKYLDRLSAGKKAKLGIARDDDSAIAVVYWKYGRGVVKEWTVHRYETKKKGGARTAGYEFRLRSETQHATRGFVSVRWTRKLGPPATASPSPVKERPRSMSARNRRSGSVSSIDGPTRRNTFNATPMLPPPTPAPEPKWEFSSPNSRRIMASMTAQKLHIPSLASNSTPVSSSSPSGSDFDDIIELPNDRELTSGRKLEFLIVSGLIVALEEDFASKLRREYLTPGAVRMAPSLEDDHVPPADDVPIIHSPRKKRAPSTMRSENRPTMAVAEKTPRSTQGVTSSSPPRRQVTQPPSNESSERPSLDTKAMTKTTSSTSQISPSVPGYVLRGWGMMTSAAAVCVTKLTSLAA